VAKLAVDPSRALPGAGWYSGKHPRLDGSSPAAKAAGDQNPLYRLSEGHQVKTCDGNPLPEATKTSARRLAMVAGVTALVAAAAWSAMAAKDSRKAPPLMEVERVSTTLPVIPQGGPEPRENEDNAVDQPGRGRPPPAPPR